MSNPLRALPLWSRWLLTILVYACVVVAVLLLIHDLNSNSQASRSEAAAEAEANREGQIAIEEDEAPHTAPLRAHAGAQAALTGAVTADVQARIRHNQLTGPLQRVRCASAGGAVAGRRPFRCTVTSAGLQYTFLGVADQRDQQLTWCKVDPPPSANAPLEVPVSPRCRA